MSYFVCSGDALAIIDADEEIFNKEHELEIPVSSPNTFTKYLELIYFVFHRNSVKVFF